LSIPNKLTILRILSIPIFVISLLNGWRAFAIIIFFFSALTDAADGIVARLFNQKTRIGSFLDPLADKLLLSTSFILLPFLPDLEFPVWVTVVVISRDLILTLGWVVLYLFTGILEVHPTLLGKLTTSTQMVTVLFYLARVKGANLLCIFMVGLAVLSTLHYIKKGSSFMNEEEKRRGESGKS
jgi:cardiolipin synthase